MDPQAPKANAWHRGIALPTKQAADAEARRLTDDDPAGYWFAHEEPGGIWRLYRLGGFRGRRPVPLRRVELPLLLRSGNGGGVGAG